MHKPTKKSCNITSAMKFTALTWKPAEKTNVHLYWAVKPIFQMTNVIKQPDSQKQWAKQWRLHQAVYRTIAHAATITYYRKQNHQRTTSDTTSVDAELDSIPLNKAAAKLCLLDSIFLSDALGFVAKACNTKYTVHLLHTEILFWKINLHLGNTKTMSTLHQIAKQYNVWSRLWTEYSNYQLLLDHKSLSKSLP